MGQGQLTCATVITMRGIRVGVIALAILLITSLPASAHRHTYTATDYLKMYAHFKIVSDKQYKCFDKIITKESLWSHTARNGSHYGLGQMRSTWYRDLNAYEQIDATLKYIAKRYETSCSALAYHRKIGWY